MGNDTTHWSDDKDSGPKKPFNEAGTASQKEQPPIGSEMVKNTKPVPVLRPDGTRTVDAEVHQARLKKDVEAARKVNEEIKAKFDLERNQKHRERGDDDRDR